MTNGERAQVLGGPVTAVDRLCALLDERGTPCTRLPVERAFHTALMEPMLDEFRAVLGEVAFEPVRIPFVSGLDGITRPPGWTPDADYFVRHTREPVRFDEALRGIGEHRVDALLEIGPHSTLSSLARQGLPDVRALASLRRGSGLSALWGAAAELHCAGADMDWRVLLEGCGGRRIPLPGYRFQHRDYWTGPELTAVGTGTELRRGAEVAQREAEIGRILHSVVESTARHLNDDPSAITGETPFFDLGADSLQMISVLRELEQEYQVKVSMRELFEESGTPRQLAEFIAARLPGAEAAPPEPVPQPVAVPDPVAPQPAALTQPAVPETPTAAVPEPAAAAPEYATREELEDLARKLHQMSQIQLQMMSQLSQLLALQTTSASLHLNGKATK